MAERKFYGLTAFAVAVILLETNQVCGCTTSFDCPGFSKPFCCKKSGLCCTSSEHSAEFFGPSDCTTNGDCTRLTKPKCCKNGECCTSSKYISESGTTEPTAGCTSSLDCPGVSEPWCCSNGECCAIDDTVKKVLAIGIGVIVGIVVGVILLCILCIVGIVCCVRSQNRNRSAANTAKPVPLAPYPAPQQGPAPVAYQGGVQQPQPPAY